MRGVRLERLITKSNRPIVLFSQAFDDPIKLLDIAERLGLEGVSKRRDGPYVSGERCGWLKFKTESWRAANRERWLTRGSDKDSSLRYPQNRAHRRAKSGFPHIFRRRCMNSCAARSCRLFARRTVTPPMTTTETRLARLMIKRIEVVSIAHGPARGPGLGIAPSQRCDS